MWPRHDDAHHVEPAPCVCDIHGKKMNRQKRANGIRMSQAQKRACACERAHACVMCACVRMPSHRPQTLTGCEIVCSCVESVMMGGADVAETRRRASCGSGPCAMTWQASEQMESEPSVRHKARTRMRESACMCACVHAEPQTLTGCKIVCLCRERDVRRRCGRDTTTRIMRNGPARVSHGGKNT